MELSPETGRLIEQNSLLIPNQKFLHLLPNQIKSNKQKLLHKFSEVFLLTLYYLIFHHKTYKLNSQLELAQLSPSV